MQNQSANNKRIAKNTLMLYIRMFLLMLVSLYTTRIVLSALGETDFGIYNVVGGFVVLFTFINGAMTTSTQRSLSYELGKNDGNISNVFSTCMNLHLLVGVAILILAETIGLWFLNHKMNFPLERMDAVNWVYQFAILNCLSNVLRVPYNALIIAHEYMSFYAYIGLIEGVLKLLIVYLLSLFGFDKLIFYSFLMFAVSSLTTMCFVVYSKNKLSHVKYTKTANKDSYKQIVSFSGWTLFGALANLGRNQGISVLLNMFYGVTINAAIGIANQVNASVNQLVTGFQQAFNPQLTKAEASQNKEYQTELIIRTSKYSYYIILFFAVPLLFNLDFILGLWLGEFPLYTKELCICIIVASLIDSISGPLWVTIFATGKIKNYQVSISILLLLILPITYVCGSNDLKPYYPYVFYAILNFFAIFLRLFYLKKYITFSLSLFFKKVLLPIFFVSLLIFLCCLTLPDENKLLMSFILILFEFIVIFYIGMNAAERTQILQLLRYKIK